MIETKIENKSIIGLECKWIGDANWIYPTNLNKTFKITSIELADDYMYYQYKDHHDKFGIEISQVKNNIALVEEKKPDDYYKLDKLCYW